MSRNNIFRGLGIALVCLVGIGVVTRTPISARTGGEPPEAARGAFNPQGASDEEPSARPIWHGSSPPMTVEVAKTWLKLQEKVAMRFPNETPLEDLKKYVEATTAGKDDPESGLELYFDPQGLQSQDKTMASTFAIDLKSVPLATSLKLALAQLGLIYFVQKDGIVVVTSPESSLALQMLDTPIDQLRREIDELRREIRANRGGMGGVMGGVMGGGVGGQGGPPTPNNPGGFRSVGGMM